VRRESSHRNKNPGRQSLHGGISSHQKPIWQWRRLDMTTSEQPR
jgi:hypothetical protein